MGYELGSLHKVIKRDGRVVDFDAQRIENAVRKACKATNTPDEELPKQVTRLVIKSLNNMFKGKTPSVEDVQNLVEETLILLGQARVAKAYILYREQRHELRVEKMKVLNKKTLDEVDKAFDLNALKVLASRYLKKDLSGRIVESPKQLFQRVALHACLSDLLHSPEFYDKQASQDVKPLKKFEDLNIEEILSKKPRIGSFFLNQYHVKWLHMLYNILNNEGKMKKTFEQVVQALCDGTADKYETFAQEYYEVMVSRKFLPNTPALVNFGHAYGMGSACFVLDVEDDLKSIMETLKNAALIFQAGGGCGYNFSKIRPKGDVVKTSTGVASGPVSFITLYDKMTEVINQGGVRRGANMGILNIDHPDIEEFIKAKEGNKALRNFNISVLIKPDFWQALENKENYKLVNPRDGSVWREISAEELFDMIAYQARNYAEPGVLFMDNINKHNPLLKALGPIITTNPCGEVLLYPNEVCNLGSVNIAEFVSFDEKTSQASVDWEELARVVRIATRFLDNTVDINNYPLEEIRRMARTTRKIGLGVMGVGDAFYKMRVRYDSQQGLEWMERFMEFVNYHSKLESIELAKLRGCFPLFEKSFYTEGKLPFEGFYSGKKHLDWDLVVSQIKRHGIRNAFTTVIAPTGSISMIAGTSSGIEPVFSLVFEKRVVVGTFFYTDPVFEQALRSSGLYSDELLSKVSENRGSLKGVEGLPDWFYNVFVTAMDISPEMHVKAQAAFQKWVDSSISKTINMPSSATVEDVKNAYLLAHKLGCKGLTVYRDGSIQEQVLVAGTGESQNIKKEGEKDQDVSGEPSEQPGSVVLEKCPVCGSTNLRRAEGCITCMNCGWSKCAVS